MENEAPLDDDRGNEETTLDLRAAGGSAGAQWGPWLALGWVLALLLLGAASLFDLPRLERALDLEAFLR